MCSACKRTMAQHWLLAHPSRLFPIDFFSVFFSFWKIRNKTTYHFKLDICFPFCDMLLRLPRESSTRKRAREKRRSKYLWRLLLFYVCYFICNLYFCVCVHECIHSMCPIRWSCSIPFVHLISSGAMAHE